MNDAIGVLVDANAERAMTSTFHKFIGHSLHFGHLVYAKKRLVMRLSLANDVNVLGNMLDRLSEQNRWFRDFTLDAIGRAVELVGDTAIDDDRLIRTDRAGVSTSPVCEAAPMRLNLSHCSSR